LGACPQAGAGAQAPEPACSRHQARAIRRQSARWGCCWPGGRRLPFDA
jgi:hypothetical protein